MKTIYTFLIFTAVSLFYILSSSIQGADIRLANGILLHYKTSGTGDIPIVLVHGYGMSSAVWEKVLPLFPSNYKLFAIDLKGFGLSDKPETGYSCNELSDDIKAFLDALGFKRAVLIGHSFGGLVIQHFAMHHPESVLALVLTNTFSATMPPKGLTQAVEKRISGYGSAEENRKIFSTTLPRYFDTDNVTEEDIKYFVEIGLQGSNTALRETLKANYTTLAIPATVYNTFLAPTLIIITTHDPFGTFDQATAISDALPKSRIEVITRCGHSPMWEKPAEFARIVAQFLQSSDVE